MTREGDPEMDVETRLADAMRHAAEAVEPPVEALVSEGAARGRRRRRRNRASAAASVLTATAVVAGGGVFVTVNEPTAPPPSVRLVGAAQVLDKAARTVQARPGAQPRPDQWWYTKAIEKGAASEHGSKPHVSESWIKLDGTKDAGMLDGKLVIYGHEGKESRNAKAENERLASLPADPGELRSMIYEKVDSMAPRDWIGSDRDGQAFRVATKMLWDAPLTIPPKVQAALYRTLATIPGVKVDKEVKDGAGRPAIALSRGFGEQYLLDPVTFQMVAQRTVNTGHNAPISAKSGPDPRYDVPVGTVMYSLTRVVTKVVDRAGQR